MVQMKFGHRTNAVRPRGIRFHQECNAGIPLPAALSLGWPAENAVPFGLTASQWEIVVSILAVLLKPLEPLIESRHPLILSSSRISTAIKGSTSTNDAFQRNDIALILSCRNKNRPFHPISPSAQRVIASAICTKCSRTWMPCLHRRSHFPRAIACESRAIAHLHAIKRLPEVPSACRKLPPSGNGWNDPNTPILSSPKISARE